ncbi:MAG: MnhB domain-containing protein [Bacillota bacterium]
MKFRDDIVSIITRLMLPFITIFGLYLIVHVHLSPGGGFSGGTVVGAGFVLLSLTYGISMQERKFSHRTSTLIESGGALAYILFGLIGLFYGNSFLTNLPIFPVGTPGRLFSAGFIALINLAIGVKVASTIIALFDSLGGEEL